VNAPSLQQLRRRFASLHSAAASGIALHAGILVCWPRNWARDCDRHDRRRADVAVNYKENKSAAEEVIVTISKSGRRAIAFGADVSVSLEVESMIAITRQLGDIGILVNNAGIARGESSRMLIS
jgi:NAD(P)-dependent dehydrogenase (short-subunit alcohol dehydrogenase family)